MDGTLVDVVQRVMVIMSNERYVVTSQVVSLITRNQYQFSHHMNWSPIHRTPPPAVILFMIHSTFTATRSNPHFIYTSCVLLFYGRSCLFC